MSVNQCNFVGRVGRDPESRQVGETSVTSFSIACSESWKDKNGQKQEKTEWVSCQAWGKLGDIISQYATKGTLLFVSGRMETRKYTDAAGIDKYSTSINVKEMRLLSSGQSQGQQQEQQGYEPPAGSNDTRDSVPF